MDTRLIIDGPARGSWNMAVDDALLESAGQGGAATLRFYQWQPATLSLGYFQKFAARDEHPPSSQIPVVRRATGGGAIVHDRELTYSFATPIRNRFSSESQDLVRLFHESLVAAFCDLGVHAAICGDIARKTSAEPFLCFQRRNPLDIVIATDKVVGSAQRTRHGVLLQHGSILLARSSFAEELPGVMDVSKANAQGPTFDHIELASRWSKRLGEQLDLKLIASSLPQSERTRATSVEQQRFANDTWTMKR